jgi:hypothetical protein
VFNHGAKILISGYVSVVGLFGRKSKLTQMRGLSPWYRSVWWGTKELKNTILPFSG